jgi:hypothetical protein
VNSKALTVCLVACAVLAYVASAYFKVPLPPELAPLLTIAAGAAKGLFTNE